MRFTDVINDPGTCRVSPWVSTTVTPSSSTRVAWQPMGFLPST